MSKLRLIISGGGTGGHVFPAIAIADAVMQLHPDTDILFVGAKDKLEMTKVPEVGYKIIGLDVRGIQRNWSVSNIRAVWKFSKALWRANNILNSFKPHAVVGVGGYASAAVLRMAAFKGIPILIHEQNSYPGLTNQWLAGAAGKICVAFDHMEKFFPRHKLIKTGNPIRKNLIQAVSRDEAYAYFNFDQGKKTIAVLGGSLGAHSINEAVLQMADQLISNRHIQLLWQTGEKYYPSLKNHRIGLAHNVYMRPFIDRMDFAYEVSDLVLARAGALTIAELAAKRKACVLVPSPNVAENHQYKNAKALADAGAAAVLLDHELQHRAFSVLTDLLADEKRLEAMRAHIGHFAALGAADAIAKEIVSLAGVQEKSPTYYFLGIGGIGMSALARHFNKQNAAVHGYDKTQTALTKQLEDEGIRVHYDDDPTKIPPQTDLVIYSPAVPTDLAEWAHIRQAGIPAKKRAQVLGEITRAHQNIAVAGTHGKTTTACLLAHILHDAGVKLCCFLGGVPKNYGTNYLNSGGDWMIEEADEYDRSFLHLRPDIAVIGSLDADHLDIYGDHNSLVESYLEFGQCLKPGGKLLLSDSIPAELIARFRTLLPQIHISTYGTQSADIKCSISGTKSGYTTFTYIKDSFNISELSFRMPGVYNAHNAIAAVDIALHLGIPSGQIRKSLSSFKGIQRRFEWIRETEHKVLIDDYAHHPAELRAAITACRDCYPGRHITGIFQPHLYSRTRDFMDEFASALAQLDQLVLVEIYPAREKPIQGINSQALFDKIDMQSKFITTKAALPELLSKLDTQVVMTLGAGDLDRMMPAIEQSLFAQLEYT